MNSFQGHLEPFKIRNMYVYDGKSNTSIVKIFKHYLPRKSAVYMIIEIILLINSYRKKFYSINTEIFKERYSTERYDK